MCPWWDWYNHFLGSLPEVIPDLLHTGIGFIHCMVVTIGLLKEFLSLSCYSCRACTLGASTLGTVKTRQSGQPLDRFNFWTCLNLNPLLDAGTLRHYGIRHNGSDILGTTLAYSLPMGECKAGWDVGWLLCELNYKLSYEASYKSSFRSANRASDLWIKLWIELRRVAALHPAKFHVCLWGGFGTSCEPNLLHSRTTVFPDLFALCKTVIWAAYS